MLAPIACHRLPGRRINNRVGLLWAFGFRYSDGRVADIYKGNPAMAFDVKGNELKVGDMVTIKAKVTKVTEGSENITVETVEPNERPGMKSTLAVRAASVQKG